VVVAEIGPLGPATAASADGRPDFRGPLAAGVGDEVEPAEPVDPVDPVGGRASAKRRGSPHILQKFIDAGFCV
jgi:hypothetical protein